MPTELISLRPNVRDNGLMAIDDMLCMHCGACGQFGRTVCGHGWL